MRSKKQKIVDMLLDMRAIQIASRKAKFNGLMMLQKITFVAGERYKASHQRVLNQSFYRWHWGPMSDDVYEDFSSMKELDLVHGAEDKEIVLTEKGEKVLLATADLFRGKEKLLSKIDGVAANVRNLDALLKEVYAMKVHVEEFDKEMQISEIPEGTEMLAPLWESEAKEVLDLGIEWAETLDLMMDPLADSKIRKSMDDAKKGKLLPLELE
jgi:Mn-dependent DtxR family transcriptional regulator